MNWKEYRRRRYEKEFKPTYDLFIKVYDFQLEDLIDERWLPIPDFEGLYEESNYGRTKSFKNGKAKILKPLLDPDGYLRVNLSKGGKHKTFRVSRLVATLFIPNPDNKPEVNHIYSRFSNHVDCLEWATRSENEKHAYDTGLAKSGEEHYKAKLTAEQARYIRENPERLTLEKLADKFSVDFSTISLIQLGKIWKQAGGSIRQSKAKYIPEEVKEQIRADYKPSVLGCGYRVLAKKYGVCQSTIFRILHENKEDK